MKMLIGELAAVTGVSSRMLRYYEEQGLLASERGSNDYRHYDPSAVERVRQIRALLGVGLPVRVADMILPCLEQPPSEGTRDLSPELVAELEKELARIVDRIECLTETSEAIMKYLAVSRELGGPSALVS